LGSKHFSALKKRAGGQRPLPSRRLFVAGSKIHVLRLHVIDFSSGIIFLLTAIDPDTDNSPDFRILFYMLKNSSIPEREQSQKSL
jgi:hypothetical protein